MIEKVVENNGALSYEGMCDCGQRFVNRWGWEYCWDCEHKKIEKVV